VPRAAPPLPEDTDEVHFNASTKDTSELPLLLGDTGDGPVGVRHLHVDFVSVSRGTIASAERERREGGGRRRGYADFSSHNAVMHCIVF